MILNRQKRRTRAILMGASAIAITVAGQVPAWAQDCTGVMCDIILDAPITVTVDEPDQSIFTNGPTVIINQATGTDISHPSSNYLLLDNQTGAVVSSITLHPPLPVAPPPVGSGYVMGLSGVSIINAGTISGDLTFANGGVYVDAGGTITGNLTSRNGDAAFGTPEFGQSFTSEAFIDRSGPGTGVQGIVNPGNGLDYYVRSYSSSDTHALSTLLPSNFEVGGVEALGIDTTVTILNEGSDPANGLVLWGNGSIINRATVNPMSLAGSGLPLEFALAVPTAVGYGGDVGKSGTVNFEVYNPGDNTFVRRQIGYGGGLSSFRNEGVINGDIALGTAGFVNEGEINLQSSHEGTRIFAAADKDFSFLNSGSITMTNTGARQLPLTDAAITLASALDKTVATKVTITNSAAGEISGGLAFSGQASDLLLENEGLIAIDANPYAERAVTLQVGDLQVPVNLDIGPDYRVADNVTVINGLSGVLEGGIAVDVTAKRLSFLNRGTILADSSDPFASAVELSTDDWDDENGNEDVLNGDLASFENSGSITGGAYLDFESTEVSIINSGDITQARATGVTLVPEQLAGLEVEQGTTLGSTFSLNNSGTISTNDYGASAIDISIQAGKLDSGIPEAADANASATIVNSGLIRSSGGSYITPGEFVGRPAGTFQTHLAAGLTVDVGAENNSTISIVNEASGVIDSRGAPSIGQPTGPFPVPNPESDASGAAILARANDISILNHGTIRAARGNVLTGAVFFDLEPDFEGVLGTGIDTFESTDNVTNSATGVIEGGIALRSGDDILTNYGLISGDIWMGSGADQLSNFGIIQGNVDLGDGNDVMTASLPGFAGQISGTIDGGAGDDSFLFSIAQGGSLQELDYSKLSSFEYVGLDGTGTVTSDGGTTMAPIELAADVDLTLAADSTLVTSAVNAFQASGEGSQTIRNLGTIQGNVALGNGDDQFFNYGTLDGSLDMGAGDDIFTQGINAVLTGLADGGDGEDRFALDITGGGQIDQSIYDKLVNFEILGLTGSGTIVSDAPLPVDTIELGDEPVEFGEDAVIETQGGTAITGTQNDDDLTNRGTIIGDIDLANGDNQLTNSGTIAGNVSAGDGNDSFANAGTITGVVDLGAGDDELLLTGDWAIGGANGGAGTDMMQMSLGSDTPTELDLSGFEFFEELQFNGGTGAINGTATFDEIDVNAGYLFGRAGSTINGNVNVGSDGTFGSSGTVNGDVDVSGTLSPGSSPGTLTINGDLSLGSNSVTLFEMTPTVSDAIVINGSLTVADGATLNITGERPLTPGVAYNLITASDGIQGAFAPANILKVETVLGFVSQTENAIQLLGTFQLGNGATVQNSLTTDYLNSLLIDGTAPEGVVAAIPALLTADGYVDEAAVATISPEAYASAAQIGIENGLAISSALRSARFSGMREDGGIFVFGEVFGQWRGFAAESTGTAKADLRTSGVLGGVGFGNSNFSVSAFVGHVDGRQNLAGYETVNNSSGEFFGASARADLDGFRAGAAAIWDQSSADTRRTLFDGTRISSDYRLRSVTFDGHVGYSLPIGNGWELGPEVGLTHVSVKRGAVTESGNAFALEVAKERYKATFLSGDLVLTGSQTATVRPYLSVGVRHMIDGDPVTATGGFLGVPTTYTALGAERDETFANVGAGINIRVTPGLSIFARGETEFGADNNAQRINGGIRFNF